VPLGLFLLALTVASTALARPRASVSKPARRATIVLLVDVSGSMRATDVKPSRLGAAEAAMDIFADRVPKSVRLGLVSFSTTPDVLVVPTTDRAIYEKESTCSDRRRNRDRRRPRPRRPRCENSSREGAARQEGRPPARSSCFPTEHKLAALHTATGRSPASHAGIRVYTVVLGTDHGTLAIDASA
jgi:Ca-activated chloride channel family protein